MDAQQPLDWLSLRCCFCGKNLKNKYQLWKHKRYIHGIHTGTKQIKCVENECQEAFAKLKDLRVHLKYKHGLRNIDDKKEFRLGSRKAFDEWLKEEEVETSTSFSMQRAEKKFKTYSLVTYYCNRSGVYNAKGHGQRQLKTQGSRKLGHYCTAQIIVKYFRGCVDVGYYHEHYRHDFLLEHIPIAASIKEGIATKLAFGIDTEEILKDFKDNIEGGAKREHLITRKDISNIRNQFQLSTASMELTFDDDLQCATKCTLNLENVEEREGSTVVLNVENVNSENMHSTDLIEKKLKELLTICGTKSTIPDSVYTPIFKHLNAIEKLFHMDSGIREPRLLNDKEPANKNVIPPKRFYSTKQNNEAKLKRPTIVALSNTKRCFF